MAISTNCCFKFKAPTARSAPPRPQNSWLSKEESRKWPSRVASILIGLEMANLVVAHSQVNSSMVGGEAQASPTMESSKRRWSEERVCQPWHLNSLENIVPENLPRPSAKRRFGAIGYGDAPQVKVVGEHDRSKCFTM